MINLGGKKVAKMLVGSSVIYQDSDGWIPLENSSDVIDGKVMFRDNGDGTGKLLGSISFYGVSPITKRIIVVTPPEGYEFTNIDNWKNMNGAPVIQYASGLGKGSAGVTYTSSIEIANGCLAIYDVGNMGINTIRFTESVTGTSSTSADPVTIGIAKV